MRPPEVVAIVLNWNRCTETLACLGSLSRLDGPRCPVVVLDAASTDGSAEAISREFPDVEVVALAENRGYAGNNNVGIEHAIARGAEWVFLLNEDVVVAPDCLAELVAVVRSDDSIGAVGPTVYHADERDVVQSAGGWLDGRWAARHRGENERDSGQFRSPVPVDWLSGCAILIRSAALEQVGMLDERFFYYWEEVDLCLRIAASGRSVVQAPKAHVWHSGVRRDYRPSPDVVYYDTRNKFLLLEKQGAPWRVKLANWARIAWTSTTWTLSPERASRREHRRAMWRGAIDFLRSRYGRRPNC